MKTIYKYRIEGKGIEVPKGAKFISMDYDCNGDLCAWAIVETDNEMEIKYFVKFGTGWVVPDDDVMNEMTFLGTIQDTPYIWHVFVQ